MKRLHFLPLVIFALLAGCTTVQHISKVDIAYQVPGKDATAADRSIDSMVAPYKMQLDERMNEVIATLGNDLVKKQPESTMGNWVADGMLWGAQQAGFPADFALSNYGGMRVPVITAGPLTVGEMFELAPFENELVVAEVPGHIVDTLFAYIASRDGWPVSANVRMRMSQKKVISLTINGQPVIPSKTYIVAMPDYVANGGDDARFMIPLPRKSTKRMQRDVLIAFAKLIASNGNPIQTTTEGRIVNQ